MPEEITASAILPAIEMVDTAHNNADDLFLTRYYSQFCDWLVRPAVEHFYKPMAEYNRPLGLVVLNATLTMPRAFEPRLGQYFENGVREGNRWKAGFALLGKMALKFTDGLDGAAARQASLTSVGGGAFDGAVDMLGTLDDSRRVIHLAQDKGDTLTSLLMYARLTIDGGVFLTAGILNGGATAYAKYRGVEISDRDKPKSNALGKLKYALGSVGTEAIEASYLASSQESGLFIKRCGQGLVILSLPVGLVSIVKYGLDGWRKIQRAQAH
jgi:hypothetical protein